jgi:anti-anti-sigma factor
MYIVLQPRYGREATGLSSGSIEISVIPERRVVILEIVGRLVPDQTAEAESSILEGHIRRGNRRVVVDLTRTEQISSTGIGLLHYYSRLLPKQGGRLVIVRPKGHVARILEMTHLDRGLTICASREEALETVEQPLPSGADVRR